MEQKTESFELNLFQGVRGHAVKILNRIDRTDAYLDKLLDIEIKNSSLSGVDKSLLFEIVKMMNPIRVKSSVMSIVANATIIKKGS